MGPAQHQYCLKGWVSSGHSPLRGPDRRGPGSGSGLSLARSPGSLLLPGSPSSRLRLAPSAFPGFPGQLPAGSPGFRFPLPPYGFRLPLPPVSRSSPCPLMTSNPFRFDIRARELIIRAGLFMLFRKRVNRMSAAAPAKCCLGHVAHPVVYGKFTERALIN